MNCKFLRCLALLVVCFSNFAHTARPTLINSTTEQTVGIRVQEVQQYYQFAQNQCTESTDAAELWNGSIVSLWYFTAKEFTEAISRYNRHDFSSGDRTLSSGLEGGLLILTLIVRRQNASHLEAMDQLLEHLRPYDGSPAHYPQEFIDYYRDLCRREDIRLNRH